VTVLHVLLFELRYQLRRRTTWIFFLAIGVIAALIVNGNFLPDAEQYQFYLNGPFVTAVVTVLAGVFWLLVAPSIAGEAAARDAETRMYPLLYTTPVRKSALLEGRFAAAFLVNALLLLAAQIGIAVAPYATTVDPDLLGPFRLDAHLVSYALLSLPSVFAATAVQFLAAALSGRPRASYLGSLALFVTSYVLSGILMANGKPGLARFLDSMGVMQIVGQLGKLWTPLEMSVRMIPLDTPFIGNRLIWLGIGAAAIALTYARFRMAHRGLTTRSERKPKPAPRVAVAGPVAIPAVHRDFGVAGRIRQVAAIAWSSFRIVARSPVGLILLVALPLINILALPGALEVGDVPMLMVTAKVANALTAPLTQLQTPWIVVPLLLILVTGDLVWREREARINDITDVTPVPDSVPFLGKFLGIAMWLVVWRLVLVLAGILAQVRMGYDAIDVPLYLETVVALQLPDYLLFTLLALTIHVVVNQKHLGYLAGVLAFAVILLGPVLGLRHNLLRFASGPQWVYTEMSGFGATLAPWLWFKLYWMAWAMLIAVATRLLWVRGRENRFSTRLQLARHRLTRAPAITAAVAMGLIVALGGFIFYNTNILNRFESPVAAEARQAEYERQYARFRDIPQPRVTDMRLKVELYPDRGALGLSGTYRLMNQSGAAIDSIHLSLAEGTDPSITLDRPATAVLVDDTLHYRILALEQPLAPGDSATLSFNLRSEPRGFGNSGVSNAIIPNGSFLLAGSWLPQVGYQWSKELNTPGDRKRHGLMERPLYPAPEDVAARSALRGDERVRFEAILGTAVGQVAVAPGELQQQWEENGRSYFRYASDAPIWNELRFMSAKYAIAEEEWRNPADSTQQVVLQVYHHPGHTAGLERLFSSARAALAYHSEQFGRYPHHLLRFVEHPGEGGALHSEETQIDYLEEFSFFHPSIGPNGLDLTFAVIAH
jgi:ABC-type transport system involved in multi-copper enzyme maturation permease subunit